MFANKSGSVFFFSLHKCATTFFTHKVLRNSIGLSQTDYQTAFYLDDAIVPNIEKYGHVYGVIRVVDAEHPVYPLTQTLLDVASAGAHKVVILVRHPFDILVSMYFSFGFSHGFSPNPELRKYQEKRREQVQSMTLDEYVLFEASTLAAKFSMLDSLRDKAQCTVIKYEDMVERFSSFYKTLSLVLPLHKDTEALLFSETRPNDVEDLGAHKRSGKVFGYKNKLDSKTVLALENEFKSVLEKFSYIG